MAVHLPEPLHTEWENLIDEHSKQYTDDDVISTEEWEKSWKSFLKAHGSRRLRRELRAIERELRKQPPGLH